MPELTDRVVQLIRDQLYQQSLRGLHEGTRMALKNVLALMDVKGKPLDEILDNIRGYAINTLEILDKLESQTAITKAPEIKESTHE